MTDFADFKAQIAEWSNREDWSDALATSFVRMAEQKLDQDLRIGDMIKTALIGITCRCADLPDNWLSSILVSIQSLDVPSGFIPIRFKSETEFFSLTDFNATNYYTMVGRTFYIGGAPDAINGRNIQLKYYARVPVFSDDTDSWVYTKYSKLFLSAAMENAFLHAVGEEDKSVGAEAKTDGMIAKLNAQWLMSKDSGSRITRTRTRSFG